MTHDKTTRVFRKLTAKEESLLYNTSEQPQVEYPAVVLPEASAEVASVDEQLRLKDLPEVTSKEGAGGLRGVFGIRRKVAVRRIQVGLDFGTSATKVMYRELAVAERKVRLLRFDHGLSEYPDFCLPSLVTFDRNGQLFLGDAAAVKNKTLGWGSGLSRLKMLVAGAVDERYLDSAWRQRFDEHIRLALGDADACTPDALAATYLAAVMRRVRRQLQREYGGDSLDLVFNTCVPVDQSERTPVVKAFERILSVALELESQESGNSTATAWMERAMRRLPEVVYDPADDQQRIFLMPEAVATAAGYVVSVRRKTGIHAVVDIGAGTTDVSICLLTLARVGGATTEWYAARSIPMGAARIEAMLASALSRSRGSASQEVVNQAMANDPRTADECGSLVVDELTRIWNGTAKAWADAYDHDRRESAWKQNAVTIFITGGGAQIPAARRVFARSTMSNWGPHPCSIIPTPEQYDATGSAPFNRLSVAFGLATPLPELGQHILPSNSTDHTPAKAPVREWRQDGDQLLPRWGWT